MARPMCSICHSAYTPDCELQTLPECGHVFHGPCVLAWFRSRVGARPARNAAASCPICRAEFSASALLRLRLDFTAAVELATQHGSQEPPADAERDARAGERQRDDPASASALLAQALADASAAAAAAADAARSNAALVRDREALRASLAAEREAARRVRAEAQAAEMRATTAAKMLALERSLGGSAASGDGGSGPACADANAVYSAAVSVLRQTQDGGSAAAADDVMRALSRAVARSNALTASVREELARAVASAGAALARAAAAEARAAAAESVARPGTLRADASALQPQTARVLPQRPPEPPAPVPRVFSSLGGIGTGPRSAAPASFLRGDAAASALSDGGAFIRSGADGRGGRHTVLVPLLPLTEQRVATNAQAAPPPAAKRARPAYAHGLERFGFGST